MLLIGSSSPTSASCSRLTRVGVSEKRLNSFTLIQLYQKWGQSLYLRRPRKTLSPENNTPSATTLNSRVYTQFTHTWPRRQRWPSMMDLKRLMWQILVSEPELILCCSARRLNNVSMLFWTFSFWRFFFIDMQHKVCANNKFCGGSDGWHSLGKSAIGPHAVCP